MMYCNQPSILALALILLLNNHQTTVQAYVTSGLPAHTHRAYLHKLTDEITSTDIPLGMLDPHTLKSTAKIMSAWATTPPDKLGSDGKDRALKVEGLLKRIIDERAAGNIDAVASTEHYNSVLKSWSSSGEGKFAAERVEQILMSMQDVYHLTGDKTVQPNQESFETAIESWLRASDEPAALERAQGIIDWMTTLYISSSNDLAKPHTSNFYPILKYLANSCTLDGPILSEHIIQHMQSLQMQQGIDTVGPDTMCFNIVMSSWLKSGDKNAEKHITEIFDYMTKAQDLGSEDIKLDSSSYNIIISSISNSIKKNENMDIEGARRADDLLTQLETNFKEGDDTLRPDTIIYNQVIDYWAKTQPVKGHYLYAREVLDRQISMYEEFKVRKCRPDILGYTSVIAACASTPYKSDVERQNAFDLAHLTFMECSKSKYMSPNDVTYGIMLKAVGRLLPKKEDKNRYAKTLFEICCSEGYLGQMAYQRMKMCTTDKMKYQLTGGRSYEELPKEWRRNVKNVRSHQQGQSRRQQQSSHSGASNKHQQTQTSKRGKLRP